MTADFSRLTFDPSNHFTRVLMQQGRVQLDADWNEQMDILWHYLRTLATDIIGPYGGPRNNLGFQITLPQTNLTTNEVEDLVIGWGRYYVDGILCENTAPQIRTKAGLEAFRETHDEMAHDDVAERTGGRVMGDVAPAPLERMMNGVSYHKQSDLPFARDAAREFELPDAPFVVYLDVWEREVSAVEEPAIREVALGGPDTAARTRTVWQVRVASVPETMMQTKCETFAYGEFFSPMLRESGRLRAKAREAEAEDSTDPCIISPDARYRGAENQLYRVEIHTGTINPYKQAPTFKWSRDNGSNTFAIVSVRDKTIFLESLGRDERSGIQAGDWVEIVDDDVSLLGEVRPLYRVESVDSSAISITLKQTAPAIGGKSGGRTTHQAYLRRWDQQSGDTTRGGLQLNEKGDNHDNAALIKDDWLNLEDGIQIQFERGGFWRAGDYWLIPARTATGDIEWPREGDTPLPLPPRGVRHHYAPLAGVFFGDHPNPSNPADIQHGLYVVDLRRRFPEAAECFIDNVG
jgi:hypothetical protein